MSRNIVDKIWDWWKDFVTNHFWKIYGFCLVVFSLDHIFHGQHPLSIIFFGLCISMMTCKFLIEDFI